MKIIVISPNNKTIYNFRGDLIKSMIAAGHTVVAIGPDRDFIDEINALGISKFIELPFVKDNTSIFGDLKYCSALKKIIKAEKPDLVFSYTIKPVIYGSIAAKSAGVKHVFPMITGLGRVYTSNSIKTRAIRFVTGILYKKAFKGCEKVIFQNHDDLNQFVDAGYLPLEKAAHIDGSGVNMNRFKFNGLPDEPVFLMTARIIKEKGIFEYCNAARIVKKKYPLAKFILLGEFDTSIGSILPKDIKPYTDDGSIEFPGVAIDVMPFLERSRFSVLPTYYREGVPRTILEAMAMGRPIITTDWPGCRDAVINGVNGFLVEPKNSIMLADKMIELIENDELAQAMSKSSLKRCISTYEVGVVNTKMNAIMGISSQTKKETVNV